MTAESIQRTLVIGLGQYGTRVCEALLQHLTQVFGPVGVIEGVAVVTETLPLDATVALPAITRIVQGTDRFQTWRDAFDTTTRAALHHISRLEQLDQLARQGLTLTQPDEVHLLVIANLAEPGLTATLPPLVEQLRQTVYQTLACHASLTGVILWVDPPDDAATDPPAAPAWPVDATIASCFDRGCLVAGLTNEVGLRVGTLPLS